MRWPSLVCDRTQVHKSLNHIILPSPVDSREQVFKAQMISSSPLGGCRGNVSGCVPT